MLTRLWLGSRQIAAVQAHRDDVPQLFRGQIALADQQKAADYTTARARLGQWATVVEALVKLLLTFGGGLAAVDAIWRHSALSEPWRGALVVATVLLLLQLVGQPFALWRTFKIEARFGFNRVSPRLYMVDLAKQWLLALLLGAPLLLATLTLMERAGEWWWGWVWLIWLAFTLGLTWAAPKFIAPLFNRFSPLTDETLKKRVETLLERCGFAARGGVFVMDGSLRSAHGNAYFTGIGRNKRIVFFDTLLSRIEAPEIEAVLAHELGHFRLHHVRQRLAASVALTFGGLALLAWLARQPGFYSALGVPHALGRDGAAAVCVDRAGDDVLCDPGPVLVVAPPGTAGRRLCRRPCRRRQSGRRPGQAVSRQCVHAHPRSHPLGILRFPSAGARAHRATARIGFRN